MFSFTVCPEKHFSVSLRILKFPGGGIKFQNLEIKIIYNNYTKQN